MELSSFLLISCVVVFLCLFVIQGIIMDGLIFLTTTLGCQVTTLRPSPTSAVSTAITSYDLHTPHPPYRKQKNHKIMCALQKVRPFEKQIEPQGQLHWNHSDSSTSGHVFMTTFFVPMSEAVLQHLCSEENL